jgi:hypothetical protein
MASWCALGFRVGELNLETLRRLAATRQIAVTSHTQVSTRWLWMLLKYIIMGALGAPGCDKLAPRPNGHISFSYSEEMPWWGLILPFNYISMDSSFVIQFNNRRKEATEFDTWVLTKPPSLWQFSPDISHLSSRHTMRYSLGNRACCISWK